MEDKAKYYSKITDEDIGIAEQFFDNDKHLDEFLANVSRYYSQRNLTIKTKIVQKYFTAYKKTMDFVLNARGTGAKGGIKAAENQTIKSDTLAGAYNNPSDTLIGTLAPNINSKVISNKNKDKTIKINSNTSKDVFEFPKSELELTFEKFVEMRKKQKKTPTDHALDLLKKKIQSLSNGNEQLAIEIINQSILNSWQDLFPLRQNQQQKNTTENLINSTFKPRFTE